MRGGSFVRWPAAALAVTSITAVYALPAPGNDPRPSPPGSVVSARPGTTSPANHPVRPSVAEYRVTGVSAERQRVLTPAGSGRTGDQLAALTTPIPATGSAVVGVTWAGPAPRGLSMVIRTKGDGAWSKWSRVPYDADHGPTAGTEEAAHERPGSDPYVVGDVDDVQLKVLSATGALPKNMKLSVVDPGTSGADAEQTTPAYQATPGGATTYDASAASTYVTAATAQSKLEVEGPTPQPTIYSRAQWGADERLRDCCVEYGEVHAGFVHHTVSSNDYTRVEVPSILRGIYAYHTQSRGWKDIGYNYLIDRFGRIWEGRYGGITMPVVGAHTLSYNENSFAASSIGNYDIARPSSAMIDAYGRLYAWKLSLHGVYPTGMQNVAGTWFKAISGHRDAAATACPGRYLYAKLPTIRALATSYQHSFQGRELYHSFTGIRTPDVLLMNPETARVSMSTGTGAPGFRRPAVLMTGFGGNDLVASVGDVTGDGRADILARNADTKTSSVYPGTGPGTIGAAQNTTAMFANSNLLTGVSDVDGDGRNDVVARDASTSALLLYRGLGRGRFASASTIRSSSTARTVTAAGDFNADGTNDLIVQGSRGAIWLYAGDGTGSFPKATVLLLGGRLLTELSGGSDVTGDGTPDLVARRSDTGMTQIIPNRTGTRLAPATELNTLWSSFPLLRLSPDLTGDGKGDLVGVTGYGRLVVLRGRAQNWLAPVAATDLFWKGAERIMVVGDWNRDGYVDSMVRGSATGRMWLHKGLSSGGFGDGAGGWTGPVGNLITPVGDFNGDGYPDLMARNPSTGVVSLYPGKGMSGFKRRIAMRSQIGDAAEIVGVGLFDGDGAPDVLVRDHDGQLWFYPGNGPGGLDDPTLLRSGFARYDRVVGVGDITGDGQPDVVARLAFDGSAWLFAGADPEGSATPGLTSARYLGTGWASYLLG